MKSLKRLHIAPKPAKENLRGPKETKRESATPTTLFFWERSGGAQFRAQCDGASVERMASVLAMQCLVRGHDPEDFAVLVPAERGLAARLAARAKELLEEGRAAATDLFLSGRQKQVLRMVISNRANKEIASALNITVRTVKFHISCLLSKFGAQNRVDLARRAAGHLQAELPQYFEPSAYAPEPESKALRPHATLVSMAPAGGAGPRPKTLRIPASALPA